MMMGTKADVLPLAEAISHNAFNLALDAGLKRPFIESIRRLSSTLDTVVFKKDAGWNQLDVILIESVFQSLTKINDTIGKERVWPDVSEAIGELLPKMDDFLDTAIFAAEKDFWVALKEIRSRDIKNYVNINSLDEL